MICGFRNYLRVEFSKWGSVKTCNMSRSLKFIPFECLRKGRGESFSLISQLDPSKFFERERRRPGREIVMLTSQEVIIRCILRSTSQWRLFTWLRCSTTRISSWLQNFPSAQLLLTYLSVLSPSLLNFGKIPNPPLYIGCQCPAFPLPMYRLWNIEIFQAVLRL